MYLIVNPGSEMIYIFSGRETDPNLAHGIVHYQEPGQEYNARIFSSETGSATGKLYYLQLPGFMCIALIKSVNFAMTLRRQFIFRRLNSFSIRFQAISIIGIAGFLSSSMKNTLANLNTNERQIIHTRSLSNLNDSHWKALLNEGKYTLSERIISAGVHAVELPVLFEQDFVSLLPLHEQTPHAFELSVEAPYREIYVLHDDGSWKKRTPKKICKGKPNFAIAPTDRLALLFRQDRLEWTSGISISAIPRNLPVPSTCHGQLAKGL